MAFPCLPEIYFPKSNSHLAVKSAAIIYLFFAIVFSFCPQEISFYVPGGTLFLRLP